MTDTLVLIVPAGGQFRLPQFAGKRVRVSVAREKASPKQFGWYRAVALPMLAEHLGYDKHEIEDLHEEILSACYGTKDGRITKTQVPSRRTSQLNTAEMAEFQDWLMRWSATEFGCVLPDPDPHWKQRKHEQQTEGVSA